MYIYVDIMTLNSLKQYNQSHMSNEYLYNIFTITLHTNIKIVQ